LISVRSELARGDLRALYLGWLLCAQNDYLDGEEIEPPVPAGLGQLSASLSSFAEFLRIDTDLLDAAAAASAPLIDTEPTSPDIHEWLARLPVAEKDDVVVRLMAGGGATLGNELVQRMRRERASAQEAGQDEAGQHEAGQAAAKRRTVAALLRAGEHAADERKRIAAEQAARQKAARERTAARARATHLERLPARNPCCGGRSRVSSPSGSRKATIRRWSCWRTSAISPRKRMKAASGGGSRRCAPRTKGSGR
jgi:hypothetical protein